MVYGHASGASLDEMLDDSPATSTAATARCARSARCPGMDKVYGVHPATGLLRAAPRACPPRRAGRPDRICASRPRMLGAVRDGSGSTCSCCTTCTTGSPPSRPAGSARTSEPTGCSGWRTPPRRASGGVPADPAAHHHTAGGRRGVQHDLGLPAPDHRAHSSTTSVHGRRTRRHLAPANIFGWPHCTACAAGPTGPRPVPVSLRRRAAARHRGAELRYPGVHGARRAEPTRCSRTNCTSRRLHAPREVPGLGVDVDEEAAARYPYYPASLPVNRLRDGTVHDW